MYFSGEGWLSNLLKEKKLYLLYHQWSWCDVLPCINKPCFAADLSNCGDGMISRDHVSCMQINIEAKLPITQGASIPSKNSLETECCVWELCYSAFLKLCHSLFKTIFILSFLAKWWHTFICKSPALWTNQCWRGCSLITHQGSGAHEHLPL